MSKKLILRAILWGLGFILMGVITLLTLETTADSPAMLAYLIALDAAFFALLRAGVIYGGIKRYELETGIKKGAITFLCINVIPLAIYVYLIAISHVRLGVIMLILNLIPVIGFFLLRISYFLTVDFDCCPKCSTICYRSSKKILATHTTTTYETTTSREKIGEIHSYDNTEHYDVYGDVSRTTSDTNTKYDYKFSHVCKCGYAWCRTRKGLDFLGNW